MFENALSNKSQLVKTILTLFLTLVVVLVQNARAETNAQLDLSPERCIALNEGQTCYQTVTVTWQADNTGDYCLMSEKMTLALVCWENSTQGKAKMEFASNETVTFRLRLTDAENIETDVAAEAQVIVTWVYSDTKRRRNSWRLF